MMVVRSPIFHVKVRGGHPTIGADELALGVSIQIQAGKSSGQSLRQRSRQGSFDLLIVVGAVFRLQFSAEVAARTAAHLIVDASRRGRAIQDRRWTLQDLEGLERIEIDTNALNGGRNRRGETVHKLTGREAAHRDEVIAQVRSVIFARYSGDVPHRLLRVDKIEEIDLITGDDRN